MGILAGKNNVQIREYYDDFLILLFLLHIGGQKKKMVMFKKVCIFFHIMKA
jgi:hypothetical protein